MTAAVLLLVDAAALLVPDSGVMASASLLLVLVAVGWAFAERRRARRRMERVARAEHELRGPVAVLRLACDRMARETAGRRYARSLEVEVERLSAALADLTAARTGRRPSPGGRGRSDDLRAFAGGALAGWAPALRAAGRRTRLDWKAGRVALPRDRGRVAQALGNLVGNAAEHGAGEVELRGRRVPGGVRVEIRNRLRKGVSGRRAGRGLAIAAEAAEQLGGTLSTEQDDRTFVAALELPLSDASKRMRERLAEQGETRRARPRQPGTAMGARPTLLRKGPTRPPGVPPGGPRPQPRPPVKPPRVNRPPTPPPRRNMNMRRM
jgi:signal transduction histidine kinase